MKRFTCDRVCNKEIDSAIHALTVIARFWAPLFDTVNTTSVFWVRSNPCTILIVVIRIQIERSMVVTAPSILSTTDDFWPNKNEKQNALTKAPKG